MAERYNLKHDLVNRKFGKLLVISVIPRDEVFTYRRWQCLCDCGNSQIAATHKLLDGDVQSCGCSLITHGLTTSAEYAVWNNLKQRCSNPNNPGYRDYGARGIQVCERWLQSFEAFYNDMGPRPSNEHSIERRDVNGHYEPNNCYWADKFTQANNKRSNISHEYNGQLYSEGQLSNMSGISVQVIRYRLKRGASVEEALSSDRFSRNPK